MSKKESDPIYEATLKTVKKAVTYLTEKMLRVAGMSKGVAGPFSGFYAPHADAFTQLVLSELKYGPGWLKISDERGKLEEWESKIKETISETPLPQGTSSLGTLFGALIAPEMARDLERDRQTFERDLREVLVRLDGVAGATERQLAMGNRYLQAVNQALEVDKPRNQFEFVIGRGSAFTARNDFCFSMARLYDQLRALVNHRNNWAKFADLAPRKAYSFSSIEEACHAFSR